MARKKQWALVVYLYDIPTLFDNYPQPQSYEVYYYAYRWQAVLASFLYSCQPLVTHVRIFKGTQP